MPGGFAVIGEKERNRPIRAFQKSSPAPSYPGPRLIYGIIIYVIYSCNRICVIGYGQLYYFVLLECWMVKPMQISPLEFGVLVPSFLSLDILMSDFKDGESNSQT